MITGTDVLAIGIAAILTVVTIVGVYWWRTVRLQRWLAQRLQSGAWVVTPCSACQGKGHCLQCGGMGTLGLMGKPCPACGGGEHSEGGHVVTLRGSGRCAVCGGYGQVYRDVHSGLTIQMSDDAVDAARSRSS